MASKKTASKTTSKTAAEPAKANDEQENTFRVDLGESIPTPPIKTATDNE